jgi:hypothetical protein
MSVENDVFDALKTLVGNRVYPLTFVQPGGQLPTWPAIRYTVVSDAIEPTVCGSGGPALADTRVQLDVVAIGYTAMRALREQVITAMEAMTTPTVWDGDGEAFDEPTRTCRARLDFVIYPSSLT